MWRTTVASVFALVLAASVASAAPVDLSTWTAESYPAVSGFNPGIWTVGGGGTSVTQSVNGQPTFFYSDFNAFGTEITGTIRITGGGDDDFVGFALGFSPGDSTSAAADYLLVDWKAGTQNFNFGAPSTSAGGIAPAGLAVSRVTGIPDADEFWQHENLAGTPAGSGVEELARGLTLGNTGWALNTDYDFVFDFGPNNLDVFVDNVLQFSLVGAFDNGRIGFYNFSQAGVIYSAFEIEDGSFPDDSVPEPASLLLVGLGLLGLKIRRHQRA